MDAVKGQTLKGDDETRKALSRQREVAMQDALAKYKANLKEQMAEGKLSADEYKTKVNQAISYSNNQARIMATNDQLMIANRDEQIKNSNLERIDDERAKEDERNAKLDSEREQDAFALRLTREELSASSKSVRKSPSPITLSFVSVSSGVPSGSSNPKTTLSTVREDASSLAVSLRIQSNQESDAATKSLLREKASEAEAISTLTDKEKAISRFLTLEKTVGKLRLSLLQACLSSGGDCDLSTGATLGEKTGKDEKGCDGERGKVVASDGRCVCPADSKFKTGCSGACEPGFTGLGCDTVRRDASSLLYQKRLDGDGVLSPSFKMECPPEMRFSDREACRRGSTCEPPFVGPTCSVCKEKERDAPHVETKEGKETWTCKPRGHFAS